MNTHLKLPLGSRCIKYLMFIFNLLFVITGIILVSIGITIRADYNDYIHFLDSKFFSVPTFFIVVGYIIFIIAFFGCCGAVRDNYCMILTFTVFLILIFILELSGGIAGYVLRHEAYDVIATKMKSTMDQYDVDDSYTKAWDFMQRNLQCCGITNATDWANSKVADVPMSCKETLGLIGQSNCLENSCTLYPTGCLTQVSNYIKLHAVQLGGIGIGLAAVQAIGIRFAIYLARAIKLSYEAV